ncbi:MAG: 50S ribosomal protein L16 [Candidatus Hodgkinia cicadicola]
MLLLQPKVSKYRKEFKGRTQLKPKAGYLIEFGAFGLQSCASCRIEASQLEAARVAIMKHVKRIGKLWIRVFPNVPVTKKPTEVRMGKGKGEVVKWIFRLSEGRILFELSGVSASLARIALSAAAFKLGFKTRFVTKAQDLSI